MSEKILEWDDKQTNKQTNNKNIQVKLHMLYTGLF